MMNISQTALIFALSTVAFHHGGSTTAFAPRPSIGTSALAQQQQMQRMQYNQQAKSASTTLFSKLGRKADEASEKAADSLDDFQKNVQKRTDKLQNKVDDASDDAQEALQKNANRLEKQAEELQKFLIVDVEGARQQLADNWGGITFTGLLTLGLGLFAFYLPTFATGVAYDGTVLTLGATGIIGVINAFLRENGHRTKSLLSGIAYVSTALLMSAYPGQGLNIITFAMATAILSEGVFETALAAKNKNIPRRGWHFASGIGSTVAALGLTASMPVSSLIAPGVALGARLTSTGATKVAVGLEGKKIADKR